jgi:hypothetical protein
MLSLRADCNRCCGLCCVVPDHLAVQDFPSDKPANTPCPRLDACNRCSIYEQRREHGYPACEGYDCFGAGQWITQKLFGGAAWTDSPDIAERMFTAYRLWAPRFEAAALLEAAMPYVSAAGARLMSERIDVLLTGSDNSAKEPSDAARLRRETLAMIRSSLTND